MGRTLSEFCTLNFIATVISSTNEMFNAHWKLRHILGAFTKQLAASSPILCPAIFWYKAARPPPDGHMYDAHLRCFLIEYNDTWGTRWFSWLRHCATSRKDSGKTPDIFIHSFIP